MVIFVELRFRAQDQGLLARRRRGAGLGWMGEKMDPAIQGLKILSFNPLFKPLFLRILKSILEKPILFMVVELGGCFF